MNKKFHELQTTLNNFLIEAKKVEQFDNRWRSSVLHLIRISFSATTKRITYKEDFIDYFY